MKKFCTEKKVRKFRERVQLLELDLRRCSAADLVRVRVWWWKALENMSLKTPQTLQEILELSFQML